MSEIASIVMDHIIPITLFLTVIIGLGGAALVLCAHDDRRPAPPVRSRADERSPPDQPPQ